MSFFKKKREALKSSPFLDYALFQVRRQLVNKCINTSCCIIGTSPDGIQALDHAILHSIEVRIFSRQNSFFNFILIVASVRKCCVLFIAGNFGICRDLAGTCPSQTAVFAGCNPAALVSSSSLSPFTGRMKVWESAQQ